MLCISSSKLVRHQLHKYEVPAPQTVASPLSQENMFAGEGIVIIIIAIIIIIIAVIIIVITAVVIIAIIVLATRTWCDHEP